ncbi:hypothetical protein ciss_16290 [Carboxydothermus islandicus]|uniref:FdrA family protein n=1 Tax=Carboxydothermus islandicus TaxID=661089 RepID=A0A1L8D3C3_9THEO|nr:acyl-CoA synthetase FdrA [Carboxydothermus islandicus]GAV25696.1 hypothetical protein ciss_16290 [Carboxydothermus islandicus]
MKKIIIKPNLYYDSVTLMRVSQALSEVPGVVNAMVGMGTDLNKDSLKNLGLFDEQVEKASANDLIIGLEVSTEEALNQALTVLEQQLTKKREEKGGSEKVYTGIEQVVNEDPEANIVLISVAGMYAAREAKKALLNGLHVFLFSDNVSVEEEIMLKDLALEKGLLMMGPDCGTAYINGTALGFANKVKKGPIGIVGASGTGTQQVMVLIDRFGSGVSQVIGTGGRDLSREVGGRMMSFGIKMLAEDPETKVIVTVSKPPAPEVAEKILSLLKSISKPAVVCFLGSDQTGFQGNDVVVVNNLEDTATMAVKLVNSKFSGTNGDQEVLAKIVNELKGKLNPHQKYLRALYGGGSLADETMQELLKDGFEVFSNIPLKPELALPSPLESRGHTVIDLGDDFFTRGKPHPMIEPALRVPRIIKESLDPETAVVLMDVILGYGCHKDPAGVTAQAVYDAKEKLAKEGREVIFIGVLVGTEGDPQNYQEQERKLKDAGVLVVNSNYQAVKLVKSILG